MAIKIENLSKSFGEKSIIRDVSFTVPDKGIFGIFGDSGCGKTTLLRIISGLDTPSSGKISGNENLKLSVVFQEDRLLPNQTVLKNVSIISDGETALKCLKTVHLDDSAGLKTEELSGGMGRRAAIARALAYNGDLFLLDEPFKGLESELKDEFFSLFEEIAKTKPVIIITHDEQIKSKIPDFIKLHRDIPAKN